MKEDLIIDAGMHTGKDEDEPLRLMNCSIIICTHNRAESLQQTLRAVLRQEYDADKLEVIVVDNCSTDHTRQIIETAARGSRYAIKYLYEPRLGLSHARNSGVKQAKGEVVIFIDDDARPREKDWAKRLAAVYVDPQISAAGGDLDPVWPDGQRPAWLHEALFPSFGLTRFNYSQITKLRYPHYPWGANISYRKKSLESLNGFSAALGRVGDVFISGEETELCLRLERAGKKIAYVPHAVVEHFIAPERLTRESLRKKGKFMGITEAKVESPHSTRRRMVINVIRKLVALIFYSTGAVIFALTPSSKPASLCRFKMLGSWFYILTALKVEIIQYTARTILLYLKLAGLSGLFRVIGAKVIKSTTVLCVNWSDCRFPFKLRGPTSDLQTFEQIFVNAWYAFLAKRQPRVIVDAGANIGLAAIYFANRYPEAKIIAIEPEQSNFELLKENVGPYANIIPLQAALWHRNEELEIEANRRLAFRRSSRFFGVHPLTDVLGSVAIVILFLLAIWMYKMDTQLMLTQLLPFIYILLRIVPLTKIINGQRTEIMGNQPYVDYVYELLRVDDKPFITDGRQIFSGLKREIQLRGVTFIYNGTPKTVLRDVNFSIPAGKTTAIIGESGAGKSTIANLLLRFYDPQQGAILLDGEPLPNFQLESYHRKIGVVSQDTFLFSNTVKFNIAFSAIAPPSDEQIIAAAKKAGAHEFIMELPNGYDTFVGDRGVKLSGGQRQRISIARAILRDPEILILDEATSALDTKTERRIHQAILELSQGRTVIIIAHRLSTIKNADQIIVLRNGQVIESGSPKGLMNQKGEYYGLTRV